MWSLSQLRNKSLKYKKGWIILKKNYFLIKAYWHLKKPEAELLKLRVPQTHLQQHNNAHADIPHAATLQRRGAFFDPRRSRCQKTPKNKRGGGGKRDAPNGTLKVKFLTEKKVPYLLKISCLHRALPCISHHFSSHFHCCQSAAFYELA